MTAKLYAMPASHPSIAAALMLERKRIALRVVWLILPFTAPALRLRDFRSAPFPPCVREAKDPGLSADLSGARGGKA